MKNPEKKLDKPLFSLETRHFVWKFENFDELQLPQEFKSTTGCLGFFLFCLDLELFAKSKKTWFLHTRFSHFY